MKHRHKINVIKVLMGDNDTCLDYYGLSIFFEGHRHRSHSIITYIEGVSAFEAFQFTRFVIMFQVF